jgi:hypothetical protein
MPNDRPRAISNPSPIALGFTAIMVLAGLLCTPRCLSLSFEQQAQSICVIDTSTPSGCLDRSATMKASTASDVSRASPLIVVGFAGGFVKRDNTAHGEIGFALHLRRKYPVGMDVETFQNHHGQKAQMAILRLLDLNHDGVLTPEEKHRARIILYGHSWGGSEVVTLARRLQSDGIPVLLTVQVDSVTKRGEHDARIPSNVAEAVNFYQLDGLLHGRSEIQAADPSATRILGNFRLHYKRNQLPCERYSWFARSFMRPHIEIESDARVWDEVDSLIASEFSRRSPRPFLPSS